MTRGRSQEIWSNQRKLQGDVTEELKSRKACEDRDAWRHVWNQPSKAGHDNCHYMK